MRWALAASLVLASAPGLAAPTPPAPPPAEVAKTQTLPEKTGAIRLEVGSLGGRTLRLDGEPITVDAPQLSALLPGPHRLALYEGDRLLGLRDVVVEPGGTLLVSLRVDEPTPRAGTGSLSLGADPRTATITIDGEGPYPTNRTVEGLQAGSHVVMISAPGHFPLTRQVEVRAGQMTNVAVELQPAGELSVTLGTRDGGPARVDVDGEWVGETPWSAPAHPGAHRVAVYRTGEFRHEQDVTVEAGLRTSVRTELAHVPDPTRRFTRGASLLDRGRLAVELSGGWPFLAEVRASGGAHDMIEASIGFATALDVVNMLTVGGKVRVLRGDKLSLAATLDAGWGIGGRSRRSLVLTPGLLGSLRMGTRAELTLGAGVRIFSDRTGPESDAAHAKRDAGVQLPLSLTVDVRFRPRWNFFVAVEGNPLARDRRLLDQGYSVDTHLYGRVGVSRIF
jgi:hypothetical protein